MSTMKDVYMIRRGEKTNFWTITGTASLGKSAYGDMKSVGGRQEPPFS
jgi:hypothetical protein